MNATLPNNVLDDIIITALEGGIGYWSAASVYKHPEEGPVYATVFELNEDETGYDETNPLQITREVIQKGVTALEASDNRYENERFIRLKYQDYDSEDADYCVQLALFGEVRYG